MNYNLLNKDTQAAVNVNKLTAHIHLTDTDVTQCAGEVHEGNRGHGSLENCQSAN